MTSTVLVTRPWLQRLVIMALVACFAGACTARYSQSLVGRVPKSKGQTVTSTATGFAILQIAIEEPKPAHEQVASLLSGCKELTGVEVDYRELVIIIVSIPRVTVTGTCVQ